MPDKPIGVPTAKGVKGAFADFAWGGVGGAVYGLTTAVMGSGFLGLLAAPVISGAVVKGSRGTAISTMAGFLAIASLFSGAGSAQASGAAEVM